MLDWYSGLIARSKQKKVEVYRFTEQSKIQHTMSTFRLVRKAPPHVSNPWEDKDFEMNSEPEDEDLDVATATKLQSPFEPALNPGQAPSQKRSALPEGMASQVGSVLAFHQSQSPERHGTLQVEEEAVSYFIC